MNKQTSRYLTDPKGYLKTLTDEEKKAYYMGIEHGQQAMENNIIRSMSNRLAFLQEPNIEVHIFSEGNTF